MNYVGIDVGKTVASSVSPTRKERSQRTHLHEHQQRHRGIRRESLPVRGVPRSPGVDGEPLDPDPRALACPDIGLKWF